MSIRITNFDEFLKFKGAKDAINESQKSTLMRIDELMNIMPLEIFETSRVVDFLDNRYLVVNQAMASATIYTIDLMSDFIRNTPDVFSFDGPFLSKLNENNEEESNDDCSRCYIEISTIDALDEESYELEQRLNEMLPSELVLQVHNKRCYLDFVKVISCPDYPEPLVVSGGRDHHIFISTFRSHQIIADLVDDDDWKAIPRCGAWDGHRYFYVGCDNGIIVSIDMKDPVHSYRRNHIGEEGFKYISASNDGKIIAAFNRDNMLFQISVPDMNVLVVDEIEDNVLDIFALDIPNPVGIFVEDDEDDDGKLYLQHID